MFVCGPQVERALFAYELRLQSVAGFAPDVVTGVVTQWVERNEKMIKELVSVAEKLQTINVYKSWDEREEIQDGNLADS
jgi:hypothetical protein